MTDTLLLMTDTPTFTCPDVTWVQLFVDSRSDNVACIKVDWLTEYTFAEANAHCTGLVTPNPSILVEPVDYLHHNLIKYLKMNGRCHEARNDVLLTFRDLFMHIHFKVCVTTILHYLWGTLYKINAPHTINMNITWLLKGDMMQER